MDKSAVAIPLRPLLLIAPNSRKWEFKQLKRKAIVKSNE